MSDDDSTGSAPKKIKKGTANDALKVTNMAQLCYTAVLRCINVFIIRGAVAPIAVVSLHQ